MGDMDVIERVLIVSMGSIGRRHLRNLRDLYPQMRIGVWHLTPTGSSDDAASVRCASRDDVALFAPQAAIIAGPATTHIEVAQTLIDLNCHLLIEKPLSDSLSNISTLLQASTAKQRILMVGYNLRFDPGFKIVAGLLATHAIGRPVSVRAEVGQYLPTWRPDRDYRQAVSARRSLGGGALLELSHEIDYVLHLFGAPQKVYAAGGRFGDLDIDVEDTVELVLYYETGPALVSIHLDFLQCCPRRCLRVIGVSGIIEWDALAGEVRWSDGMHWTTAWKDPVRDRNDMYRDELQHFFQCIKTGAPPVCSGEDGVRALELIECARRSMATFSAIDYRTGPTL